MSNTTIRIADVMQKHCSWYILKNPSLIIATESALISVEFDKFFVTEFPGLEDPCMYVNHLKEEWKGT